LASSGLFRGDVAITLYESIEQAMDYKIVQLGVKQLDLLVNEDRTLVLDVAVYSHYFLAQHVTSAAGPVLTTVRNDQTPFT
jgi:hypothetical protein